MDHNEFNKILKKRLQAIVNTLGKKAQEYATNGNRFHNFDEAAMRRGITPEKALDGMMLKHEVSVSDLIKYAECMPEAITEELIDEKIGDNINYLILLEGLLKRRIRNGVS